MTDCHGMACHLFGWFGKKELEQKILCAKLVTGAVLSCQILKRKEWQRCEADRVLEAQEAVSGAQGQGKARQEARPDASCFRAQKRYPPKMILHPPGSAGTPGRKAEHGSASPGGFVFEKQKNRLTI